MCVCVRWGTSVVQQGEEEEEEEEERETSVNDVVVTDSEVDMEEEEEDSVSRCVSTGEQMKSFSLFSGGLHVAREGGRSP